MKVYYYLIVIEQLKPKTQSYYICNTLSQYSVKKLISLLKNDNKNQHDRSFATYNLQSILSIKCINCIAELTVILIKKKKIIVVSTFIEKLRVPLNIQ